MQSKRQSGATHDNGSHLRSISKNVAYRNWQPLLSMAAKCSAFEIKLTFGFSTWDNQCIWVQGSMQLENCPQSWWQARKLASCIISLAGTTGSAQAAHDTVLSPSLILCLFITEEIGAEWMMSAGADLKAWESHKPSYYTCSVNGQEIITSSWSFCSISVQCAQRDLQT